jgi:hypothetical protein
MDTEENRPVEVRSNDGLGPAPRWWHCDTHGPGNHTAWGCPECVRELRTERAGLMQALRDEIDENLRLRELGGALPDENITAMTERVIAERNAMRAAALGVVVHMEGRMPVRGWLRDNDKSRAAFIEPGQWVRHADECDKCSRYRRGRGVTLWLDGRLKPAHVGWYERLFTDGVFQHYWSGSKWFSNPRNAPHWRQVGDYPCWRGLTCTAFMRPSRYPVARAPNV